MEIFLTFIAQYGLAAIVLLITLEYACFPMPSEILLPLSGAIAAQQGIPFLLIYFLSLLAGLIGCVFCYMVGKMGGYLLIENLQKKVPKSQKGLMAAQEKFDRYAGWAVALGRMIPICRTYISFIAGAGQQPIGQFLSCSAAGIALWNFLLLGGGYLFRENWQWMTMHYEQLCVVLLVLLLFAILFLVLRSFRGKKHKEFVLIKRK